MNYQIQTPVLDAVEGFLKQTGMKKTTFGVRSVNDGKLVSQLRNGRRLWPETERKVRDFIEATTPVSQPRQAPE